MSIKSSETVTNPDAAFKTWKQNPTPENFEAAVSAYEETLKDRKEIEKLSERAGIFSEIGCSQKFLVLATALKRFIYKATGAEMYNGDTLGYRKAVVHSSYVLAKAHLKNNETEKALEVYAEMYSAAMSGLISVYYDMLEKRGC
jgi:pentatricopeptide repeat protein